MKKVAILVCVLASLALARGYDYKGVKPVDNELYKKECGSCHFAYQPGLLPAKSWEFVMSSLMDHYGVDAEISANKNAQISEYLLANSSEKAMNYKRSAKLTKSLQPGVLYKSITQIPYHIKKHEEIEKHLITQKEVRTLANCSACHKNVDKGTFSKKEVDIPNYGKWNK